MIVKTHPGVVCFWSLCVYQCYLWYKPDQYNTVCKVSYIKGIREPEEWYLRSGELDGRQEGVEGHQRCHGRQHHGSEQLRPGRVHERYFSEICFSAALKSKKVNMRWYITKHIQQTVCEKALKTSNQTARNSLLPLVIRFNFVWKWDYSFPFINAIVSKYYACLL